jgi:hypothetical protein
VEVQTDVLSVPKLGPPIDATDGDDDDDDDDDKII